MPVHVAPVTSSTIVVAIDVGKTSALFSVTDADRHGLIKPAEFVMNRSGLALLTTVENPASRDG